MILRKHCYKYKRILCGKKCWDKNKECDVATGCDIFFLTIPYFKLV